MRTILDEIVEWKKTEVATSKKSCSFADLCSLVERAPRPRDFKAALRHPGMSLIAEIKRASPSKGIIRADLDPLALAHTYQANGASAISVLADQRYFQGSLQDLQAVRQHVGLPVLCKEFIIDPYQVYQARAVGADAVLLIAAALSDVQLVSLYALAVELSMSVLVEVHNKAELLRALAITPSIVGINNRNLHTFEVDLDTTVRLRPCVPPEVVLVAESGIRTRADVLRLAESGVDAILVGESLVRADDPAHQVHELIGFQTVGAGR